MGRIVLNTFGSLGDVHPYLALAIRLRERGHETVLATSEVYRNKALAEAVEFALVRPNVSELLGQANLLKKLWDTRRGSEYLIREYILPQLEDSYQDLLLACRGADLILTHAASYAGPIVAEVMRVPWLSVILQPIVFFSAYDPPWLPAAGRWNAVFRVGPIPFRLLTRLAQVQLNRWAGPIHQLRESVGLERAKDNVLLRGQLSPFGTLALFSEHFAKPQRDWPANTRQTGFVFYDGRGNMPSVAEPRDAKALNAFLAAGTAPVLFTLGSSAVMHPENFFRESIAAAEMAGVRAVLLAGPLDASAASTADSIHVASYLPYREIMPHSAAVVHQGGIGTTAQALRAGRPMLVVPWAHDQPENAMRLKRLGVARVLPRERYRAPRVARELKRLLNDPFYKFRATALGAKIAAEDGLTAACDAIENFMTSHAPQ
ncbi:MAG: glycosyltransferase family 1 protein [Acidobacteriaceae bacterium]|nr:glycosyltransferase family 1 protein [Acidobacteriaceae bacterium]